MNSDQILSLIRYIMTILGTIATARGWISTDQSSALLTDTMAVAGPALTLVSLAWSMVAHTADAKIASVNSVPGVKVVEAGAPSRTVTKAPT